MMLDNDDALRKTSSHSEMQEGARAARLFVALGVKEDGAAASSTGGGGGASTLSSQGGALGDLGMIPNGPLRTNVPKGIVICPGCGYRVKEEYGKKMVTCPECGERFMKPQTQKTVDERFAEFREERIIEHRGQQTQRFECIPHLVDAMMESVKRVPYLIPEGDTMSQMELDERLRNTLHGFINWSIRRELGNE